MEFDPAKYGPEVARVLALDGNGNRLTPLTCVPLPFSGGGEAQRILKTWGPGPIVYGGRRSGGGYGLRAVLFVLRGSARTGESLHQLRGLSVARDCVQRQEGDSGNAAYWFRKAHEHPIYEALSESAAKILVRYPRAEFRAGRWDPFAFLSFCDRARQQPGSSHEMAALEIQRAEWQLLFDYCARPTR